MIIDTGFSVDIARSSVAVKNGGARVGLDGCFTLIGMIEVL